MKLILTLVVCALGAAVALWMVRSLELSAHDDDLDWLSYRDTYTDGLDAKWRTLARGR